MSLETMTKLATTTVGVTAQSSISFTNIPQGYTDLVIKVSARTAAAQGVAELSFNSVTSGLSSRILYGIGSGSAGSASYASSIRGGYIVGTDYTASVFANNEIYISNYSSNTFKSVSVDSVTENNATEAYSQLTSGLWSNSSPITSLTFTVLNNGNGVPSTFTQHSTFTLYGIKNARQTAGNSIKATGGNIVFDGTYVYHVFPTTGSFTPTQPILADVLVVAGGGAGGGQNAGGGGAGGLLSFSSQPLIAQSYTCTVGAGGTSVYNSSATNGSNSLFGALTASIGGGAGGWFTGGAQANAQNGGSGGGAGGIPNNNLSGGSPTLGQGNAGGNTTTAVNSYAGAGGGGAGAAGSNSPASEVGGAGGIGATSGFINSIGSATGAGERSGTSYYFAGGGGGGGDTTNGAGGLGGGGAAAGTSPTAGTANTGGGGGGARGAVAGGAGGSGIIVVRYKG